MIDQTNQGFREKIEKWRNVEQSWSNSMNFYYQNLMKEKLYIAILLFRVSTNGVSINDTDPFVSSQLLNSISSNRSLHASRLKIKLKLYEE